MTKTTPLFSQPLLLCRFTVILVCVLALLGVERGYAQSTGVSSELPAVPEALQGLVERGAQMRYLGREHGLNGWIAIYQGQEQYYYVTADGKAFVTGLMFGADGRPITVEQVSDLQKQSGGTLDFLAEDSAQSLQTKTPDVMESVTEGLKAKSPAERLFGEIENSNWIRLGAEAAPIAYIFVDPQCPHCHEFMQKLRTDYIEKQALQVRIIPVGFQQGSLSQAAYLLAAPDAASRFYRHLDGDKDALPAKSDISTQAIQKNMALMQAWKFNVTPLTVYRNKKGEIKILRGVAKDPGAMVSDLGVSAEPLSSGARLPASSPDETGERKQ